MTIYNILFLFDHAQCFAYLTLPVQIGIVSPTMCRANQGEYHDVTFVGTGTFSNVFSSEQCKEARWVASARLTHSRVTMAFCPTFGAPSVRSHAATESLHCLNGANRSQGIPKFITLDEKPRDALFVPLGRFSEGVPQTEDVANGQMREDQLQQHVIHREAAWSTMSDYSHRIYSDHLSSRWLTPQTRNDFVDLPV